MKKKYTQPEMKFIELTVAEIITLSNEDVFVDGGDLFGDDF